MEMGPLRRSGVGAGEGSGDKEGEKSLSVCLQPRDDRRGCRPVVDGGAEESGRGKSKRVFRSRRLQLGWLGSSAASHKDGRFEVRVQRRRGLERAGVGLFAFVGERGRKPGAGRCGRGRAGSWSLRCCEGGVLESWGQLMGGSRVGGSSSVLGGEKRGVCAKI